MRRSRPVRSAVRCALALVTATIAVGGAWQAVSASTTPATASAARGQLMARHQHVVATEADNMTSVTLRRGDTLTVTLSSGWSIPQTSDTRKLHADGVARPMFVCPPNAMCATPAPSATFTARSVGTATVNATKSPQCPPGGMCPMYMQIYRLSVTVTR
jgi:hypothetical protein